MAKPNYNKSPYFDDFDKDKRFTKILFRNNRAVQARELTQMQTALQWQVEQCSNLLVKQGDYIVPGEVSYSLDISYVKNGSTANDPSSLYSKEVEGRTTGVAMEIFYSTEANGTDPQTFFGRYTSAGRNVKLTIHTIVGTFSRGDIVTGQTSGATGEVLIYDGPLLILRKSSTCNFEDNERITSTEGSAYIRKSTDYTKNQFTFLAEEVLFLQSDRSDTGITVAAENTTPVGNSSMAFINDGMYYVDGSFVPVEQQSIILDKYSNLPSYRIGLQIQHAVVTADDDSSLLDPSQASSNYLAEGADRNKTTLVLTKKALTTAEDENNSEFIEMVRLNQGIVQKIISFNQSPVLEDTLARRTFDESGNYIVRPFGIEVREHDNSITDPSGRPGLYSNGDETKIAIGLEPGKAYVKGYEIETSYTQYIDIDKARDYAEETGGGVGRINTSPGNFVYATDLYKIPEINNPNNWSNDIYPVVDLIDDDYIAITGIKPTVKSTDVLADGTTTVNLSSELKEVFDNDNIFKDGLFIVTGGTGQGQVRTITKFDTSNNNVDVSASFTTPLDNTSEFDLLGPRPDGNSPHQGSIIGSAKVKNVELLKGTHGIGSIYKLYLFDIDMNPGKTFSMVKCVANSESSDNNSAPSDFRCNLLTEITIEDFSGTNFSKWNWAAKRYTAWNAKRPYYLVKSIRGDGSTDEVYGFVYDWNVNKNKMLVKTVCGQTVNSHKFSSYFSPGDHIVEYSEPNTIDESLTGASGIIVRRQKFFNIEQNTLLFKLPQNTVKDIEGLTISRVTRTFKGVVANGRVSFSLSGYGESFVSENISDYILSVDSGSQGATGIRNDFTIDVSGSTLNITIDDARNGDAVTLIAPVSKSNPTPKSKTLSATQTQDVMSRINVQRDDGIIINNADIYEIVSVKMSTQSVFEDSTYNDAGEVDITNNFTLDNGQRDNFYDFGRLILKPNARLPEKPIRIKYRYFIHSNNGDYFSVRSYNSSQISYADIPLYVSKNTGKTFRLSDCIDFRPKKSRNNRFVRSDYDGGVTYDATAQIDLPSSSSYAEANTFQYYLNRIDKLCLDFTGNFKVIKGTSAVNPAIPPDPNDGIPLYVLNLKAYTTTLQDVVPSFIENKRYTMRDIGKLEKRIEDLEYYTSMSLLEKETADMKITDEIGERYKNGFIVDSFFGHNIGDVSHPDYKCAIDSALGYLRPQYVSEAIDFEWSSDETDGIDGTDYSKTGSLITLPIENHIIFAYNNLCSRTDITINPFRPYRYRGYIELDPPNDYWKSAKVRPEILINTEGLMDSIIKGSDENSTIGSIWDEWRQNWFGVDYNDTDSSRSEINKKKEWNYENWKANNRNTPISNYRQTRTAIRSKKITGNIRKTVGNKIVNINYVPYMRSREIEFNAYGLMPNTRYYPFMDSINVSSRCRSLLTSSPKRFDDRGTELVSDQYGRLTGQYDYDYRMDTDSFRAGDRVFKVTSSSNNESDAQASAQSIYSIKGLLDVAQDGITSTRVSDLVDYMSVRNTFNNTTKQNGTWANPLAQTFIVGEDGGCFATKVNLFFTEKGTYDTPVQIEIRSLNNGALGRKIVPFSRTEVNWSSVNAASNANVATTFTFPSPVYLEDSEEYGLVVKTVSNAYKLATAKIGEDDRTTGETISKQPYIGKLYTSQNTRQNSGSVNDQDLKFRLYRAQFNINKTPSIVFTNANVSSDYLDTTPFITTNNSSLVRVVHRNHGMTNGSIVDLNGVDNDQNGISAENFNSTFAITNATLDDYIISVSGETADVTGFANTASNSVVIASHNAQMDSMYFHPQVLNFPTTTISWGIQAITNNYGLSGSYENIEPDSTYEFDSTRVIASYSNEHHMLGGSKSVKIRGTLSSTINWLSPVIDTGRIGVIALGNRIDNRTSYNDSSYNSEVDDRRVIWNVSDQIGFKGNKYFQSGEVGFDKRVWIYARDFAPNGNVYANQNTYLTFAGEGSEFHSNNIWYSSKTRKDVESGIRLAMFYDNIIRLLKYDEFGQEEEIARGTITGNYDWFGDGLELANVKGDFKTSNSTFLGVTPEAVDHLYTWIYSEDDFIDPATTPNAHGGTSPVSGVNAETWFSYSPDIAPYDHYPYLFDEFWSSNGWSNANTRFTQRMGRTNTYAHIYTTGDDKFFNMYEVGDRLNVESDGKIKNEIYDASITSLYSVGNTIVTYYGNRNTQSIHTANVIESGQTTITKVDGRSLVYSNTESYSNLLQTLEVGKYIQISGASEEENNEDLWLVKNIDSNGNVEVDGNLTWESPSDAAISIVQRENFKSDTAPYGGVSETVYMTRQVSLPKTADALKVFIDAKIPENGYVDVYYKVAEANTPKAFDDLKWNTFNLEEDFTLPDNDYIYGGPDEVIAADEDEFRQYEYTAQNLSDFTTFAIKIVLRSSSTTEIPLVKDLRAIATSI